ncbi:nucleolar protein [Anaeramoeba flamelloides]|uniref:Nucleolar protein n=1 Tax=Anaeramoeba flamelloides TaxID=1746091 RepID=A0ABQ8YN17_9EUKA|nr:nucleolar protein [Anaeramoeba flamelloides]
MSSQMLRNCGGKILGIVPDPINKQYIMTIENQGICSFDLENGTVVKSYNISPNTLLTHPAFFHPELKKYVVIQDSNTVLTLNFEDKNFEDATKTKIKGNIKFSLTSKKLGKNFLLIDTNGAISLFNLTTLKVISEKKLLMDEGSNENVLWSKLIEKRDDLILLVLSKRESNQQQAFVLRKYLIKKIKNNEKFAILDTTPFILEPPLPVKTLTTQQEKKEEEVKSQNKKKNKNKKSKKNTKDRKKKNTSNTTFDFKKTQPTVVQCCYSLPSQLLCIWWDLNLLSVYKFDFKKDPALLWYEKQNIGGKANECNLILSQDKLVYFICHSTASKKINLNLLNLEYGVNQSSIEINLKKNQKNLKLGPLCRINNFNNNNDHNKLLITDTLLAIGSELWLCSFEKDNYLPLLSSCLQKKNTTTTTTNNTTIMKNTGTNIKESEDEFKSFVIIDLERRLNEKTSNDNSKSSKRNRNVNENENDLTNKFQSPIILEFENTNKIWQKTVSQEEKMKNSIIELIDLLENNNGDNKKRKNKKKNKEKEKNRKKIQNLFDLLFKNKTEIKYTIPNKFLLKLLKAIFKSNEENFLRELLLQNYLNTSQIPNLIELFIDYNNLNILILACNHIKDISESDILLLLKHALKLIEKELSIDFKDNIFLRRQFMKSLVLSELIPKIINLPINSIFIHHSLKKLDDKEAALLLEIFNYWITFMNKRHSQHRWKSFQVIFEWINLLIDSHFQTFIFNPNSRKVLLELQVNVENFVKFCKNIDELSGLIESTQIGEQNNQDFYSVQVLHIDFLQENN